MKRLYLDILQIYLELFPCVGIIGPRQCGKTTLAQMLGDGWLHIDLERQTDYDLVERDPDLFLRLHPDRVIFDEAQRLPQLFNALRVAIDDQRNTTSRFIVTGSSSPALMQNISESLAGRIAVIEMSPLLWAETTTEPRISLPVQAVAEHAAPTADQITNGGTNRTLQEQMTYWFQGGYPEPWVRNNPQFTELWQDQYLGTYFDRDISRLFPGLNQHVFRKFTGLLGGLSGDIISYANIARALGVSQPTVKTYFEIVHGTFIWRLLPPYERNVTKRIVKHPKGYLRDSGLLHRLLHIPHPKALQQHPRFAMSWEGMVIEELIRQFICAGKKVAPYFYRTSAGAEVDLILESSFGLLPVEIKYSQSVDSRDLRSLKDFMREHACIQGWVINNDLYPRMLDENILSIPFRFL